MTRQDLNGKQYTDIENLLDEELNKYKAEVDNIMSLDELVKIEEELMKEAQEYDDYLNTVEYSLPDEVNYNNKHYSKKELTKIITNSINKLEVEWSLTLGLYELINEWTRTDLAKISYKVYNSTLRTLNQVKYKGYTEWRDILAVNNFLSNCHNEYSLDTSWNILISEKHNHILKRAELIRKENNIVDEFKVVTEA